MAFSLSKEMKQRLSNEPVLELNKPELKPEQNQKEETVSEDAPDATTRRPKRGAKSKTVVVSFRYENQPPEFSETLIRKLLQQYNKKNPIVAIRLFRHKFYIDFNEAPELALVHEVFEQFFTKCEVFAHYDLPNSSDLNTVYLGRIRGCDVATITQAALQFVSGIKQVRIPLKDGVPANFGYIECNNREDVLQLVRKLNGMQLGLSDALRASPLIKNVDE